MSSSSSYGAAAPVTEAQLQQALIAAARVRGWRVAHFRPAQTRGGRWQTAMQGDAGFPDLVLARAGVVYVWELKGYDSRSRLGKPSDAQRVWLDELGAIARLVTPDDLDDALLALELGRWPE